MTAWNELFEAARPAFAQRRTFERARALGAAGLACLGRHTLSGLLCTSAQQFADWSGSYRLFEQERLHLEALWRVPLSATLAALPAAVPVVALMDDTLVRKRGHHIVGTSWRRDPLGPHFTNNFIWASRFLQISLALPAQPGAAAGSARAIPVDLVHAPSPRKPSRRALPQQWQDWRDASRAANISARGAQRLQALRQALDAQPTAAERQLLACADATFTNRTVLKDLPPRTTLIGRIRKDARLYALPTAAEENRGPGRRRCYGLRLPTPEQLRQDDRFPWQPVEAFAAGNLHRFEIKRIAPLRWKHAGGERQLQLLIVRPIAYRPRRGAHLLYHKPAYLVCTDPQLPAQQLLQAYLWRWEIEVNFRDEKTLLGLGQPQVRTAAAIRTAAAFLVFLYALLLLALQRCGLVHTPLPRPRWHRPLRKRPITRITTAQALSLFRAELWSQALGLANKNGFAAPPPGAPKPLEMFNSLQSAVLYSTQ
jgi:hypothetical protein